jgi:hypothetical protein
MKTKLVLNLQKKLIAVPLCLLSLNSLAGSGRCSVDELMEKIYGRIRILDFPSTRTHEVPNGMTFSLVANLNLKEPSDSRLLVWRDNYTKKLWGPEITPTELETMQISNGGISLKEAAKKHCAELKIKGFPGVRWKVPSTQQFLIAAGNPINLATITVETQNRFLGTVPGIGNKYWMVNDVHTEVPELPLMFSCNKGVTGAGVFTPSLRCISD